MSHARSIPVRRGMAFVESLVSILLVSGLVVVSLNTLGAAKAARQSTGDRGRAQLLAIDLLSEIMQAHYSEPDAGQQELGLPLILDLPVLGEIVVALGIDNGEAAGTRAKFDDVDDYDALIESPPKYKDGTTIPGFADWSRCVEVIYVYPANTNLFSDTDRGVKRITVRVKRGEEELAAVFGLRTGTPVGASAVHIIPVEQ